MSLAFEPHRVELDDLVLRPFVASDEDAVAEALRDPDILRWTAKCVLDRFICSEKMGGNRFMSMSGDCSRSALIERDLCLVLHIG